MARHTGPVCRLCRREGMKLFLKGTRCDTPKCGIDFHYIQYQTVGGANESATASGALMIPTGGSACTGNRART